MSCYHPLKAFDISAIDGLTKNNKKNYKITSYEVNHIELINNKLIPFADSYRSAKCERYISDFIEIPCGKCIGCRLDYSRDWANRMMLEASYHEQNYFITLTYDDLHVPKSYYPCPETGEAIPSLTLSKRDVQLFLKRLRKLTGQKFRYYLCGEYGSTTHRPHYHLIVFGLELDDLQPLKTSDGWHYYTSATIDRAWSIYDRKLDTSSSIGYSMVTSVCWETCAYVARYVTKKLNGSAAEFYETFNILPEFCLMSRRPGIARQYFEDNTSDILKYQKIILPSKEKSFQFRPPRYYDRLLDIDYPDEMSDIREIRKRTAENARKMKLSKTDLNYIQLLAVEESNKLKQIKSLDRSEI